MHPGFGVASSSTPCLDNPIPSSHSCICVSTTEPQGCCPARYSQLRVSVRLPPDWVAPRSTRGWVSLNTALIPCVSVSQPVRMTTPVSICREWELPRHKMQHCSLTLLVPLDLLNSLLPAFNCQTKSQFKKNKFQPKSEFHHEVFCRQPRLGVLSRRGAL
jgi:hypothetical protein